MDGVSERLQISTLLPDAYRHLLAMSATVGKAAADAGLDPVILELVRVRASQLNGCAFCVDLHSHDALAAGERQQRLLLLPVWREAGQFTDQEQAALALAEAMTRLPIDQEVPDDVYDRAAEAFTPEQFGVVAWAVTTINALNRLGTLGRMLPPTR